MVMHRSLGGVDMLRFYRAMPCHRLYQPDSGLALLICYEGLRSRATNSSTDFATSETC